MRLPYTSNAFEEYVRGSKIRDIAHTKPRTPRSEFRFAEPIGIDAWGVKHSQFVGDRELNAIYQVKDDVVHLIAGTGQIGQKDGDGLTEATFAYIRSVTALSESIAVMSAICTRIIVRLINRTTNRVTTLT